MFCQVGIPSFVDFGIPATDPVMFLLYLGYKKKQPHLTTGLLFEI